MEQETKSKPVDIFVIPHTLSNQKDNGSGKLSDGNEASRADKGMTLSVFRIKKGLQFQVTTNFENGHAAECLKSLIGLAQQRKQ